MSNVRPIATRFERRQAQQLSMPSRVLAALEGERDTLSAIEIAAKMHTDAKRLRVVLWELASNGRLTAWGQAHHTRWSLPGLTPKAASRVRGIVVSLPVVGHMQNRPGNRREDCARYSHCLAAASAGDWTSASCPPRCEHERQRDHGAELEAIVNARMEQ